MEDKVISPCISICKTDPVSGFCYGCARTNDEKKNTISFSLSNNILRTDTATISALSIISYPYGL